jgi:hypothetical protein
MGPDSFFGAAAARRLAGPWLSRHHAVPDAGRLPSSRTWRPATPSGPRVGHRTGVPSREPATGRGRRVVAGMAGRVFRARRHGRGDFSHPAPSSYRPRCPCGHRWRPVIGRLPPPSTRPCPRPPALALRRPHHGGRAVPSPPFGRVPDQFRAAERQVSAGHRPRLKPWVLASSGRDRSRRSGGSGPDGLLVRRQTSSENTAVR